jgi:aldose 1-epimerase
MLTNHIYWNLNAFKAANILEDHTVQMPASRRFLHTKPGLVPNGTIGDVTRDFDGALNFLAPKPVGRDMNSTNYVCSEGCHGYDHCWIVDRQRGQERDALVPILNAYSSTTGIFLSVSSNQQAVQVYTCNWMGGNIPVKPSQVARNAGEGVEFIQKYGCVAIEPHGWVDGINNPEWGQTWNQIYSPRTAPAVNTQVYTFSTA